MLETIKKSNIPVLISFSICPFVQRSAIVLHEKNQAFERINIDLSNKPDWFLALSPTGRVPLLAINNASKNTMSVLFESAVINEYLDETVEPPLLAQAPLLKAKERAMISYSEELLMQQFALLMSTEQSDFEEKKHSLFTNISKLEQISNDRNTSELNLLDASAAPLFMRLVLLPELYEELKHHIGHEHALVKWIDTLCNHPSVIKSVTTEFPQQFKDYFKDKGSAAFV